MRVKAPAPDPNVALAQNRQIGLAENQNKYWEENFAPKMLDQMQFGLDLSKRQSDLMEDDSKFLRGIANEDRQRHKDTTQKYQDKFFAQADAYGTGEAEGDRQAGMVMSDVQRNYDQGLDSARRGVERMGINPASGRYSDILAKNIPELSLQKTMAANMARQAAKEQGLKYTAMSAGMGSGGDWKNTYGMAQGSGQNAMGAAGAGMGMIGQGSGMMNNNTNTMSNTWGNVAKIGMNYDNMKFEANKANAAGVNKMLGMGMSWMMGPGG